MNWNVLASIIEAVSSKAGHESLGQDEAAEFGRAVHRLARQCRTTGFVHGKAVDSSDETYRRVARLLRDLQWTLLPVIDLLNNQDESHESQDFFLEPLDKS